MAWNPSVKSPLGYGRQPIKNLQEIFKGERPSLPSMYPAKYLPVKTEIKKLEEYYVLEAGVIAALDSNGYLVPANGGAAQTITYAANDTDYTVDVDDATSFVSGAGNASATLAANLPIGWINEHIMSYTYEERHVNYKFQDFMGILCDYVVEFPLLWTEQTAGDQALTNGCLIAPLGASVDSSNQCGAPVRFRHGTDSVEQICGRCQWLDDIAEIDNMSKVRTVKGLGLSGDGTDGIHSWLVGTHEGGDAAAKYARVAIDLM